MAKRVYRKKQFLPSYLMGPVSERSPEEFKLEMIAQRLGFAPFEILTRDGMRKFAVRLARECVDGFDSPPEIQPRGRPADTKKWDVLRVVDQLMRDAEGKGEKVTVTQICQYLAGPKGRKQFPDLPKVARRTLENIYHSANNKYQAWRRDADARQAARSTPGK